MRKHHMETITVELSLGNEISESADPRDGKFVIACSRLHFRQNWTALPSPRAILILALAFGDLTHK